MIFQSLEIFLALLFSLCFSFLGRLNINAEFITQVIGEFKLCVAVAIVNIIISLLCWSRVSFLDVLLEVTEEEEALAELNVLHQGVRQAVADLLEVKVAEGRCDPLRIETGSEVPCLIALIFFYQWVPLGLAFFMPLWHGGAKLLLHLLTYGEHLVELGSLSSHGPFFLDAILFSRLSWLGLRWLLRRPHNTVIL